MVLLELLSNRSAKILRLRFFEIILPKLKFKEMNILIIKQEFVSCSPDGRCNLPFTAVGSQCLSFENATQQSWQISRNICQVDGGDLVTFDDCEQFSIVANYIIEHGEYLNN
jgi:hypothetical protein